MTTKEITIRKKFNMTADMYLDGNYGNCRHLGDMTVKQAVSAAKKAAKELLQMGRTHVQAFIYANSLCIGHVTMTATICTEELYKGAIRLICD